MTIEKEAYEKVAEIYNDAMHKLNNSISCYLRRRINESVIAASLERFKTQNRSTISNLQEEKLQALKDRFEAFEKQYGETEPELVGLFKEQKIHIQLDLATIMTDTYDRCLSRDDPEFQKVLAMSESYEKHRKLGLYHARFLAESEGCFQLKLEQALQKMNKNLGERLLDDGLKAVRGEQERLCVELQRQIEAQQMKVEELEMEMIPLENALACMDALFAEMEEEYEHLE